MNKLNKLIKFKLSWIGLSLGFDVRNLGYVWFSENLRKNAKERKYRGIVKGKKKWMKIKNRVKDDKLFLIAISNLFYLF